MDYKDQMRFLQLAIDQVSRKRGDQVEFVKQEGRYLRVIFTDKTSLERSTGEFYFTPNDTTVQFRVSSASSSSGSGALSSLSNMERCEMIRKQLRFTKIPVLRNRSRTLWFGESELDTFGPGSAMLGPPAEMSSGELEGRLSDIEDPRQRLGRSIDRVQQFPVQPK